MASSTWGSLVFGLLDMCKLILLVGSSKGSLNWVRIFFKYLFHWWKMNKRKKKKMEDFWG